MRRPLGAYLLWTLFCISLECARAAPSLSDGLVQNITRLDRGDVFYVAGGECGVTRCGEVSGGTAIIATPPGGNRGCACRCGGGLPLFREDRVMCVSQIAECPLAQFGTGDAGTKVPLVFLPLPGQIIHPSKEVYFTDVDKTACAVSSAQYLTRTGWSSLREPLDNDVPFSLYRDEGRTYLMWRGSEETRYRVTGRIVVVRLACRSDHHALFPCVAFRIQGTPPDLPNEIPAVFFSRDDMFPLTPPSHVASLSTTLLLCLLVGTLIYAGAFVFYVRSKRRHLLALSEGVRKAKEPPAGEMPNTTTNPLLSLSSFLADSRTSSCELLTDKDGSSRSFSSLSSVTDSLDRPEPKEQNETYRVDKDNNSETCATIHYTKPSTPSSPCMSVLVERRPELHVNIVEDLEPVCKFGRTCHLPPVGNVRKKLYFNPAFLEPHMLKKPPPAAVEFLTKIREVIVMAKDKMLSKRFNPCLPAIVEERFCYEMQFSLNNDLFKNKMRALSLKRENSRRRNYCSGCPGCKTVKLQDIFRNTLSEKEFCKTCTSTDAKDIIVRKWLDRIPIIESVCETTITSGESTTKIKGIPESIKPKNIAADGGTKVEKNIRDDIKQQRKKERESLQAPPDPPKRSTSLSESIEESDEPKESRVTKKKDEDIINIPISPELKKKMNAVINELSKYRRVEPIVPRVPSPVTEVATPFIPKLVIPVTPKVINNANNQNKTSTVNGNGKTINNVEKEYSKDSNGKKCEYEMDSLDRSNIQRRESANKVQYDNEPIVENHKVHGKKRASIIPMDKLEPMKKIQEMNSRLSKNFNKNDNNSSNSSSSSDGEKVEDSPTCKSYTIQRSNLVSEVYINDFINTMSSTSDSEYSSPNSSIIQIGDTPSNVPSQLVIEVESIPENKPRPFSEESFFDPDTLERKAATGKYGCGPIVKPKNIDQIFLKSPGSFIEETFKFNDMPSVNGIESNDNSSDVNFNYSKAVDSTYMFNDDSKVFYENCVFNGFNNSLNSGSRSLSEIFLEKKDEIKPPLPPKKVIGKKRMNLLTQINTSRVLLNGQINAVTNGSETYRITRSEPPTINTFIEVDDKPTFHRPLILEIQEHKLFKSRSVANDDDKCENNNKEEYVSIDPSYDYYSTYEYKREYSNGENEHEARRQNKKSIKYRNKIISKHSKTEDSGYLSSDSDEKQKTKFILQVRDKDPGFKDVVSDTDDLESIGDARSESGAESIETNSVFFGSLRTLSSIRKAQELRDGFADVKSEMLKSSDECKELRSSVSITSPRDKLAALDDL